jgi:hypothetical protein
MATLLQIYNTRTHPNLKVRTSSALLTYAKTIQAESVETLHHAERLAMANACLGNETYLQLITSAAMFEIGTNPTIAADPDNADDNAILYVVNNSLDNLALQHPPA